MRDNDPQNDLALLFAEEDAKLDSDDFTGQVMARVRRQTLLRRLTVGTCGVIGAGIALMQVPDILSAFVGVDHTVTHALASAQSELGTMIASNPLWAGMIAAAALTGFAISTLERG